MGKVGQRSWLERFLLAEALFGVLLASALVKLVPFRVLSVLLGLHPGDGPAGVLPSPEETTGRIGWALGAVARRLPGSGTCLAQSLAGTAMLRRRGLPATVYLGVAREDSAGFMAHAWLRCGDSILTGRHNGRFTTIAVFTTHQGTTG